MLQFITLKKKINVVYKKLKKKKSDIKIAMTTFFRHAQYFFLCV
jgi:hypothetical protein